ncbi:MAG: hypothetical protein J3K34DRAFT_156357 [Monoraphidium minutum]|nr:MAG: hypothetical protein J3K34DRAFT_156357 [Monoraphidium minutum]
MMELSVAPELSVTRDGAALPLRLLDGFAIHAPGAAGHAVQLDDLQLLQPRAGRDRHAGRRQRPRRAADDGPYPGVVHRPGGCARGVDRHRSRMVPPGRAQRGLRVRVGPHAAPRRDRGARGAHAARRPGRAGRRRAGARAAGRRAGAEQRAVLGARARPRGQLPGAAATGAARGRPVQAEG